MAVFGFIVGVLVCLWLTVGAVWGTLMMRLLGSDGWWNLFFLVFWTTVSVGAWYLLLTNAPFTLTVD